MGQVEVSALRYAGVASRHGRSPLLKLQSDERLVGMVRRGNQGAFEVLVGRYNSRLLSFCRHMLGSREDAEDVLQDVLAASYNAMLADDRPINVRPWLYRIARNRCLNHLRRNRAVGVDSMDVHLAEHGATTADKVNEREEFRQLLHDIRDLPETQRSALVLREMDALSYEQIAEAMETTVSSVKSLLVRARVSLTEAAEARLLTCEEVREELAEIAEGMRRKQSTSVRRHVKNCSRCQIFQSEMRKSTRALAALAPIGPLAFFHKLLLAHAATHSAGSAGAGVAGAAGAGSAGAAGAGAAGAGAAGAAGVAGGASSAGLVTVGVGAVATKAAAGIAAAALVTAGTVAIDHGDHHRHGGPPSAVLVQRALSSGLQSAVGSTQLGGSVGSGPGLSIATISTRVARTPQGAITRSAVTAPTTAPRHTIPGGTVTSADATTQTQPNQLNAPPPAQNASATADPSVNTSGGAGLGTGATASTPTTSTPTTTASSPTTTDQVQTGTALTGTTATETTAADTNTTTGTSTSPTTTAPTGTSTSPTTTAPTGTTTTPGETTTAPASTTTSSTTPSQVDTTTGSSSGATASNQP